MEHFGSIHRVKEAYDSLKNRMGRIRKESERTIERALQVVETAGTCGAWGYVNGRWGTVSQHDANAQKEVQLLGVPADIGTGVVLLGVSFFGGLGKYDEHGFNVGTGSASAFAYRMGNELGEKAGAAHPRTTTTKGLGRGAYGRNAHTVFEEQGEPVFR